MKQNKKKKRYNSTKYMINIYEDYNNTCDFKLMKIKKTFYSNMELESLSKMILLSINMHHITGNNVRILLNDTKTLVRIHPVITYL